MLSQEQTDSSGTMAIVARGPSRFGRPNRGLRDHAEGLRAVPGGASGAGNASREAILDVFFAYLSAMRARGVDLELYKSLQDMVRLQWDWKQSEDAFGRRGRRVWRLFHRFSPFFRGFGACFHRFFESEDGVQPGGDDDAAALREAALGGQPHHGSGRADRPGNRWKRHEDR